MTDMFSLVWSCGEETFPKTNKGDAYKWYQISAIWEKHNAISLNKIINHLLTD